ncbi:serine/threonine-protein kinase [Rheinheimera mangrovi]|uniref:serine/threonine-protein kinase n=1 Tax=Rheinheimera mangrovi TaxID=2498451 RepID=UPI000F8D3655|nr:serine/threonine-protein kinase [Rheinheimera mangrovi]
MNLYEAFADAIALPTAEQQQQFLVMLHEQSKELAQQLAQMLKAAADAGEHTLGVKHIMANTAAKWCAADFSAQLSGMQLDVWRLDQLLAQGGMSAVYLASRQDGQFEQQVAIKVLNPLIYPVSPQTKAFDEAGLCARLHHKAITTILDAGVVSFNDGQAHYIVMEYVDGQPLSDWLTQKKPDITKLLVLITELCDALHFAHTHQVIHADLKPANILVDTQGHARLIDFGISQLQHNEQGTDEQVQLYVRALSCGFASPEQMKGEALSTLSDLFSLGKVLEHALTAIAPELPKHNKLYYRELQAIIHKATAIEPSQRYLSIRDLQQDITAVLQKRPVTAIKSSGLYRLHKFVLRQPWLTALATTLVTAAIGFGLTLWQHNKVLQQERQMADQVADFMVEVFKAADPESYDSNPISAQDLLLTAKNKLQTLNASEQVLHRLQLQLASALHGVGEYKHSLDLLEQIPNSSSLYVNKHLLTVSVKLDQSELEPALALLQQLNPEQLSEHSRLKYYLYQANIAHFNSEYQQSLDWLKQAEQIARQMPQYSDLVTIKNYEVANYIQLGNAAMQLQAAKEAEVIAKTHFGESSGELITALHSLQNALASNEDYEESGVVLENVLRLKKQIYPKDHPTIAMALNELGSNYASLEQYDKAVEQHQQAIQMIEGRFGQKHIDYIYGNAYLGNAYGFLQQHEQAIAAHQLSYSASEKFLGPDNLVTLNALNNLGRAFHEKGDHQKAKTLVETGLEMARKQFDEDSLRLALFKATYGSILLALNDVAGAQLNLEQALTVMKNTLGEAHTRYQRTFEKYKQAQQLSNG